MLKILIVILFTTLTGLLSNIIASWIEPIISKRKRLTFIMFVILSVIGGFLASENSIFNDINSEKISAAREGSLIKEGNYITRDNKIKKKLLPKKQSTKHFENKFTKDNIFPQFILDLNAEIESIGFVPKTDHLLSSVYTTVRFFRQPIPNRIDIWDSETGFRNKKLIKSDIISGKISISENGRYLYTYINLLELNCIDIETNRILTSYPIDDINSMFNFCLVSKDDSLLISHTFTKSTIYDNINKKIISEFSWLPRIDFTSESVTAIALSNNKKYFIACTNIGNIFSINTANSELLYKFSSNIVYGETNEIKGITLLKNSKEFITVGSSIQHWKFDKIIILLKKYQYEGYTSGIAIAETLDLFATSDTKGIITFWRLSTGENIGSIKSGIPISSIVFSSSGKYLAVSGKKQIHIWDVNKLFYY